MDRVPAPGQDPHALTSPAPGISCCRPRRRPPPQSYKVGALVIEAPWTRATPGGAQVAGGYLKITNTGNEADRLVGGSLPIASAVRDARNGHGRRRHEDAHA